MKKVIFLAIAAAAALTACSKSEVIDSKYGNEAITFEHYVGRDAQTKATPYHSKSLPAEIGLYGYYLGNLTAWNTELTANLWNKTKLAAVNEWVADPERYWANATDNYTFLAYAPFENTNLSVASSVEGKTDGEDPQVTYNVPTTLGDQIDLLYSNNNKLIQQQDEVTLQMKHALARLTVKASAEEGEFTFHIKEVKLTGNFYKTGTFNLYNGQWLPGTPATETYTFYTNGPAATADNGLTSVDYSGTVTTTTTGEDGATTTTTTYGNNYLMMIPVSFAKYPAKLYVKYTTRYSGQESTPIEKELEIDNEFVMGNAYSINLTFSHTEQPILFTVTVDDWVDAEAINGGNPNEDTSWKKPGEGNDVPETPVEPEQGEGE